MDQYERLRKRNAYIEQYKREAIFSDSLSEFDDCKEVALGLVDEYKACEGENYLVRSFDLTRQTRAKLTKCLAHFRITAKWRHQATARTREHRDAVIGSAAVPLSALVLFDHAANGGGRLGNVRSSTVARGALCDRGRCERRFTPEVQVKRPIGTQGVVFQQAGITPSWVLPTASRYLCAAICQLTIKALPSATE